MEYWIIDCHPPPPPPPPIGESLDEMRLLEEQARKIAEEANRDKPKSKGMSFVK